MDEFETSIYRIFIKNQKHYLKLNKKLYICTDIYSNY